MAHLSVLASNFSDNLVNIGDQGGARKKGRGGKSFDF
jgi:hypothetical protein